MQDAPMPALVDNRPKVEASPGGMQRYLLTLASAIVLGLSLLWIAFSVLCYDGGVTHDFFSQIAKEGDENWYRNFGGRHVPQIQDQDIFYSNVGHSVASARASDIVFLGPSFVSYA